MSHAYHICIKTQQCFTVGYFSVTDLQRWQFCPAASRRRARQEGGPTAHARSGPAPSALRWRAARRFQQRHQLLEPGGAGADGQQLAVAILRDDPEPVFVVVEHGLVHIVMKILPISLEYRFY